MSNDNIVPLQRRKTSPLQKQTTTRQLRKSAQEIYRALMELSAEVLEGNESYAHLDHQDAQIHFQFGEPCKAETHASELHTLLNKIKNPRGDTRREKDLNRAMYVGMFIKHLRLVAHIAITTPCATRLVGELIELKAEIERPRRTQTNHWFWHYDHSFSHRIDEAITTLIRKIEGEIILYF
ncbi:hypothetical protein HY620_00250, partial [Candidatus Uhrbacteria bacterium]|nr:hypothetical protein [Candidatus Uhrbacteria bacterium]